MYKRFVLVGYATSGAADLQQLPFWIDVGDDFRFARRGPLGLRICVEVQVRHRLRHLQSVLYGSEKSGDVSRRSMMSGSRILRAGFFPAEYREYLAPEKEDEFR